MTERPANGWAAAADEPLPYPNMWDWTPPRSGPGATEEDIFQRHVEFRKICRKRTRERVFSVRDYLTFFAWLESEGFEAAVIGGCAVGLYADRARRQIAVWRPRPSCLTSDSLSMSP